MNTGLSAAPVAVSVYSTVGGMVQVLSALNDSAGLQTAGLQTAGWLCGGLDAESAAAAAAKRNVDVTPVGRYSQGRVVSAGLQLGFAALDATEIRRGVRELAVALDGERKALHPRSQMFPRSRRSRCSRFDLPM